MRRGRGSASTCASVRAEPEARVNRLLLCTVAFACTVLTLPLARENAMAMQHLVMVLVVGIVMAVSRFVPSAPRSAFILLAVVTATAVGTSLNMLTAGWILAGVATYLGGVMFGSATPPSQVARQMVWIVAPAALYGLYIAARDGVVTDLAGFMGNKNAFGLLMALGVTFLAFADDWRRAHRVSWMVCMTMVGSCLLWSTSVASILAGVLAVGCRVIVPAVRRLSSGGRAALAGVLIPLTIAATLILPHLLNAVLGVFDRDATLTGRTDIWGYGIELWRSRPVIGIGFGYLQQFEHFAQTRIARLSGIGYNLHSGHLRMLVETGVVGAIAYVAFLWHHLRVAIAAPRLSQMRGASIAALPLALVMVFVVVNAVETRLFGPLLFTLGIVHGLSARSRSVEPLSRRWVIGAGGRAVAEVRE